MYDYIIVGSGFFGSLCAYELKKRNNKVLVLEKRNHIGGNCYTNKLNDIHIHEYGPHIFHTSDKKIWEWVNQFCEFNNFILMPVANYHGELYPLPFNMWTFNKLWGVSSVEEAQKIINDSSKRIQHEPTNLEEQAIKLVGVEIYEKLIKGYTIKQWKKDPSLLPKEIIKRLPVRYTFNNNYFDDIYQGIPIGGYTKIFEKLLENIEIRLNTDFLINKEYWESISRKIIYTGPIDKYYNYIFGDLEYKTTKFEHELFNIKNYQGTAMMNYTDLETPYTRIIEHKHFDYVDNDFTWVTKEYPINYDKNINEPYYPINDFKNNEIYKKYERLSKAEKNIYFGGRLAEYKYYDMHKVIESAFLFLDKILN